MTGFRRSSGRATLWWPSRIFPPSGDLDFNVLPEFQGVWFSERHLDAKDPGVGGSAGIIGTSLAADDGVGDLFDLALPATAGIPLRRNGRFRRQGDGGNIEFVDLGLNPQAGSDRRSSQGENRE